MEVEYREFPPGLLVNGTWQRKLDVAVRFGDAPPDAAWRWSDEVAWFALGGAPRPGVIMFKRSGNWLCSQPEPPPDALGVAVLPVPAMLAFDPVGLAPPLRTQPAR